MTHKEKHGTPVPSGLYKASERFLVVKGLTRSARLDLGSALKYHYSLETTMLTDYTKTRLRRLAPYELVRWSDE